MAGINPISLFNHIISPNIFLGRERIQMILQSADFKQFHIKIQKEEINKHTANTVDRFNDSIEYATQFALMHPSTALIVTADHETGNLVESSFHKAGFTFRTDEHTNKDVSIFALGAGTEIFNGATVENVELAKFVASVYSNESFGMDMGELN